MEDGGEDPPVGFPVKVVFLEDLEDAVQGFVFQEDGAENGGLRLEVLRRKTLSQKVHGRFLQRLRLFLCRRSRNHIHFQLRGYFRVELNGNRKGAQRLDRGGEMDLSAVEGEPFFGQKFLEIQGGDGAEKFFALPDRPGHRARERINLSRQGEGPLLFIPGLLEKQLLLALQEMDIYGRGFQSLFFRDQVVSSKPRGDLDKVSRLPQGRHILN
jgi:hypothetical protein